jgi:hypothetical protein
MRKPAVQVVDARPGCGRGDARRSPIFLRRSAIPGRGRRREQDRRSGADDYLAAEVSTAWEWEIRFPRLGGAGATAPVTSWDLARRLGRAARGGGRDDEGAKPKRR